MPMDPRKRAQWGSRRGKAGEDLLQAAKQVGPLAASFVPGVGEAMDARDAYTSLKGGDYLGAGISAAALGLGLIPGVGDAAAAGLRRGKQFARGAGMLAKGDKAGKLAMKGALGKGRQLKGPLKPQVAYATSDFGAELPGYFPSPSAKAHMRSQLGLDPNKGTGKALLHDMAREFENPNLAIGGAEDIIPLRQGGSKDLDYKRYKLPEGVDADGSYIHSTYAGDEPLNYLGGKQGGVSTGYANPVSIEGATTQSRPGRNFAVATDEAKYGGELHDTLGQALDAKYKTKTKGPVGPTMSSKKENYMRKLLDKAELTAKEEEELMGLMEMADAAGIAYNKGGQVKIRNPLAADIKNWKPRIVKPRKGRGSYSRKGKGPLAGGY